VSDQKKPTNAWVLLDLETTGLDEDEAEILEIYAHQIDPVTLDLLGTPFESVVKLPSGFDHTRVDAYVHHMHTNNQLWLQCSTAAESAAQVGYRFYLWLCGVSPKPQTIHLVGNSVGSFDMRFLKEHMRKAFDHLHHRVVDVSTYRETYRYWVGEPPKQDAAHRAKEDCMMSLEGLRWAKGLLDIRSLSIEAAQNKENASADPR
jgi:oligoribonuclease